MDSNENKNCLANNAKSKLEKSPADGPEFGQSGSKANVVVHFMREFDPRVVFGDSDNVDEDLILEIGGKYRVDVEYWHRGDSVVKTIQVELKDPTEEGKTCASLKAASDSDGEATTGEATTDAQHVATASSLAIALSSLVWLASA